MTTPQPFAAPPSEDLSRLPLPPGSGGLPLMGETLSFLKSPKDFLRERRRRHGDIFRSHLLGSPTIFLMGPEATRWGFAGENKYLRVRWNYGIRQLLGEHSVAMLSGEAHMKRRRLLAPQFTYATLRDFLPRIEAIARRHFEQWAAEQGVLQGRERVRALVFEVALALILGDTPVDAARLGRLFQQWSAGLFTPLPVALPFTPFGRALAARKEMLAYLEERVAERQRLAEQPKDILGSLLSARDEEGQPLSREVVVHELQVQLFAGHDTTVTALTWLLLLLAQHPEVLERCREEQRGVGAPLTLESLKAMPYLHQVLQESLRLIPPVGGVFREALQDVSFKGYRIPKGWTVVLSLGGTHQGPPWTEPDRFVPERMGPERAEQKQPGTWIPFGGGPRVCLGQHFAMVSMAVTLSLLLKGYDWSLAPGQDVSLTPFPLPHPRDGLLMRVSRR